MLVSAGDDDGFGSATHTPAGACRVPGMHQGSAADAPAQSQASTSADIPRRRWQESVPSAASAGIILPPPPGPPPGKPPGPPPGKPPGAPLGAPYGLPPPSPRYAEPRAPPPPPPPPPQPQLQPPPQPPPQQQTEHSALSSFDYLGGATQQPSPPPPPPPPPPQQQQQQQQQQSQSQQQQACPPRRPPGGADTRHRVRDVVMVMGLQARPEFNEARAVVEAWDETKGRYAAYLPFSSHPLTTHPSSLLQRSTATDNPLPPLTNPHRPSPTLTAPHQPSPGTRCVSSAKVRRRPCSR